MPDGLRGSGLTKAGLRASVLAARDTLTPHEIEARSEAIHRRLYARPAFQNARTMLLYATYGSEVRTVPVIERALAEGKRVALPLIEADANRLRPLAVRSLARDTMPGVWGIPQPLAGRCPEVPLDAIQLILTPGVAFDEGCFRLGHGKGYYDRLLEAARNAAPRVIAMAAAFDVQVVPRLPVEPHDQPVDLILTETRTLQREPAWLPTESR